MNVCLKKNEQLNEREKKFPSNIVDILRENSNEAEAHELGRIVIKLPLPPGCVSTLYHNDKKFKEIYFSRYPVSFSPFFFFFFFIHFLLM